MKIFNRFDDGDDAERLDKVCYAVKPFALITANSIFIYEKKQFIALIF